MRCDDMRLQHFEVALTSKQRHRSTGASLAPTIGCVRLVHNSHLSLFPSAMAFHLTTSQDSTTLARLPATFSIGDMVLHSHSRMMGTGHHTQASHTTMRLCISKVGTFTPQRTTPSEVTAAKPRCISSMLMPTATKVLY